MTRREAQELATILYERRVSIRRWGTESRDAHERMLSLLADDLYTKYVKKHLLVISPVRWRDACHNGTPVFLKS